jgi:hypothetical protein
MNDPHHDEPASRTRSWSLRTTVAAAVAAVVLAAAGGTALAAVADTAGGDTGPGGMTNRWGGRPGQPGQPGQQGGVGGAPSFRAPPTGVPPATLPDADATTT